MPCCSREKSRAFFTTRIISQKDAVRYPASNRSRLPRFFLIDRHVCLHIFFISTPSILYTFVLHTLVYHYSNKNKAQYARVSGMPCLYFFFSCSFQNFHLLC